MLLLCRSILTWMPPLNFENVLRKLVPRTRAKLWIEFPLKRNFRSSSILCLFFLLLHAESKRDDDGDASFINSFLHSRQLILISLNRLLSYVVQHIYDNAFMTACHVMLTHVYHWKKNSRNYIVALLRFCFHLQCPPVIRVLARTEQFIIYKKLLSTSRHCVNIKLCSLERIIFNKCLMQFLHLLYIN